MEKFELKKENGKKVVTLTDEGGIIVLRIDGDAILGLYDEHYNLYEQDLKDLYK